VTNDEYSEEASFLKNQLVTTRILVGTHEQHSFIPLATEIIEVRDFFSGCPEKRQEQMTKATSSTVRFAAINGCVIVMYDGSCWLARVITSMCRKLMKLK